MYLDCRATVKRLSEVSCTKLAYHTLQVQYTRQNQGSCECLFTYIISCIYSYHSISHIIAKLGRSHCIVSYNYCEVASQFTSALHAHNFCLALFFGKTQLSMSGEGFKNNLVTCSIKYTFTPLLFRWFELKSFLHDVSFQQHIQIAPAGLHNCRIYNTTHIRRCGLSEDVEQSRIDIYM